MDSRPFDELWREAAPAIYAWAVLHVRPPLRASLEPDDVLQEVACRAWAGFGTWDGARGPFRAWAFGIAHNVLREGLRRLAAEPGARGGALLSTERWQAVPDTATAVTRAVARDEGLLRFLRRVESLPDDERRLLVWRGLQGLSHAEVADRLATSPDAVAKRWERLRERLRDEPRWSELMVA
jgi:RNA polymerase sigma factor (sigma-70 family)